MRSIRQEVKIWDAKAIDGSPELLGLKGSPTWVKEIFTPTARAGGAVFDTTEDKDAAVDNFLNAFFTKEQHLLNEIITKDQA